MNKLITGRVAQHAFSATALAVLVACGGGGGAQRTSSAPPSATVNAQSYSVSTSNIELKTGNSQPVTIRALVKDAGNAAVPGVEVSFASTGGVLSAAKAVTDASGAAAVTLTAGDDQSNKVITVTSTVPGLGTQTTLVQLTGTTLSVGGPTGAVVGQSVNFVLTLKNSEGAVLAGNTVSAKVTGGSVNAVTAITNSSGQATFSVTPDGSSNQVQLAASALGASAIATLQVSTLSQSFTSPSADTTVPTGSGCQPLVYQSVGAGGTATFSINRGQLYSNSTCTTSLSPVQPVTLTAGSATVYAASPAPGPAIVQGSAGGGATSVPIRFIATVPASLLNQVSPSVVAAGQSATTQASVKDVGGNPVEGVTVYFSVPSGNGSVSPASAVTDSTGVATVSFTAGSSQSGQNSVIIQATAPIPNTSPVQSVNGQATATISNSANTISMGTDGKIYITPDNLYQLRYFATLSDSSGAPLANRNVTFSRRYINYGKGYYTFNGTDWVRQSYTNCLAEDSNGNGFLDQGEFDTNGNGRLDPDGDARLNPTATGGGSASAITVKTDSAGLAAIYIDYLPDHATWVGVELDAASTVDGVNTTANRTFTLSSPSSVLKDADNPPPFVVSPFGRATTCTNPN